MKNKPVDALLLYGSSEENADIFYATKMFVPDAHIYIQKKNKKMVILNDLELDRGKKQAQVDRVLSFSTYQSKALKTRDRRGTTADVIEVALKELKVKNVGVPSNFPLFLADILRSRNFNLIPQPEPFFPERRFKTKTEVKHISESIHHTEQAIHKAIQFIKKTTVKQGYLWHRGKKVTPADIKKIINVSLMENECVAQHSIVAGGDEACDPHNTGFKPIPAHKPIVMDIFPKSIKTGYYADITRTVVRGKPSQAVLDLYQTVLEGQKIGFDLAGPGVRGSDIHEAICDYFESKGYKTGKKNGFIQGFFHGTGHGLGLDVHEAPRVSLGNDILQPGDVVTIEPGLYYRGIGGIRIEDDILITKTGCKKLSTYSKKFVV